MAAKLHGVVAQRRIAQAPQGASGWGKWPGPGAVPARPFRLGNRGQKRKKVTAITDEGCCLIYLKGETKPAWNKGNTPCPGPRTVPASCFTPCSGRLSCCRRYTFRPEARSANILAGTGGIFQARLFVSAPASCEVACRARRLPAGTMHPG